LKVNTVLSPPSAIKVLSFASITNAQFLSLFDVIGVAVGAIVGVTSGTTVGTTGVVDVDGVGVVGVVGVAVGFAVATTRFALTVTVFFNVLTVFFFLFFTTAFITVFPLLFAVTTPLAVTVATAFFELLKETFPPAGLFLTVNVYFLPTVIVFTVFPQLGAFAAEASIGLDERTNAHAKPAATVLDSLLCFFISHFSFIKPKYTSCAYFLFVKFCALSFLFRNKNYTYETEQLNIIKKRKKLQAHFNKPIIFFTFFF
jgi:hypothetical protein